MRLELKELDVSQNRKLKTLDCVFNKIKKLNLRKNKKLKSLSCDYFVEIKNAPKGVDIL